LATDELSSGPWGLRAQRRGAGRARSRTAPWSRCATRATIPGHALYNSASDIRLRWLSRGGARSWSGRASSCCGACKEADQLRRRVLRLPEVANAYRIAHAEGDDLPGLIVDRLATA
jgi:23S rRNA G2069 N7-methylase RlmK/C1962 C5-methylase RlmI